MTRKPRTIEQMQAMAYDHAQFMLIDDPDKPQLLPTFWIQFDDGRPGDMVVAPWEDEQGQSMVIETIRQRLANPHVLSYAFVSEVWSALETPGKRSHLTPSQHPQRREQVMVHVFDRHGKGGAKTYDIKRNRAGVITALPEDKAMDGGRWEGRMFNLFTRPNPGVVPRSHVAQPPTTRTPSSACLDCGALITAGTDVNTHEAYRPPQAGDIAICLGCAHIMLYADDLTVRALTDAEMIEIAGDPDVVRAVNSIAQLNKQERKA